MKHLTQQTSLVLGCVFQTRRQPALPLCLCVRRGLRHHGDRLSRGRGQDQVHELTAGPVQECYQLCLDNVDQRRAHRVLQRVSAASLIAQTWFHLVWVANDIWLFTYYFLPPSHRFVPSFLRLGSWNVVMFVSFEQIKRAMMVTKKRIEAKNWDCRLKCLNKGLEPVGRGSLRNSCKAHPSFFLFFPFSFVVFFGHTVAKKKLLLKGILDKLLLWLKLN